jgi:hypothetical protein
MGEEVNGDSYRAIELHESDRGIDETRVMCHDLTMNQMTNGVMPLVGKCGSKEFILKTANEMVPILKSWLKADNEGNKGSNEMVARKLQAANEGNEGCSN